MIYLKAFIAGFVSTLLFHQALLWLLHASGFSPYAHLKIQGSCESDGVILLLHP
jgi:hypothetical protein